MELDHRVRQRGDMGKSLTGDDMLACMVAFAWAGPQHEPKIERLTILDNESRTPWQSTYEQQNSSHADN